MPRTRVERPRGGGTVDAISIIYRLDAGEDVTYTNAIITGDLDFTKLSDREQEDKYRGNQQKWRMHVRNRLTFNGCTFKGKVLGYLSESSNWNVMKNPLYNVDFHEPVVFKNCEFRKDAHFKYSRFYSQVSFAGSRFSNDALFKYTKFDEIPDFSATVYEEEANFKYTGFTRGVTFSGASFEDDANFKYTDFKRGIDFTNATFDGDADFKYANFGSEAKLDGVDFGRRADFKYAKLDGRKYQPY